MKAVLLSTFLALFFAFVAAQSTNVPFYITSPLQGDSFKAGSTVDIKWNNGVDGTAKVSLLTGTNAATMKPTGISFDINGSDGEYSWKVPSDLPQNATFSLQITYTDPSTKNPATVYSAPFGLTGTTGDVVTQSFVSTISSALPSSASSIIPSASVSVSSVRPLTALPSSSASSSASSSVAASATPTAPSAANAGFKAPTIAICIVALIASALFL